jgi:hypothetical protein
MSKSIHVNLSISGPVVLEKKSLEIFFRFVNTYKNSFPYYGPIQHPGAWFLYTWFCTLSERFQVSLRIPGPVVRDKNKFELFWSSGSWECDFKIIFFYINTCKNSFPCYGPSDSLGPWFLWIWFCTLSESFQVNLSLSVLAVLRKWFQNILLPYKHL